MKVDKLVDSQSAKVYGPCNDNYGRDKSICQSVSIETPKSQMGKELLDAVKDRVKDINMTVSESEKFYHGASFGAQWQQSNSQQQGDNWISIKTQAPPVCTSVLAYGERSGINIRYFSKGYETLNREEFEKLSSVTHWQPLPNKPQ